MHSRTHVGSSSIVCPFCSNGYATAAGLIIHLEAGVCKSGLDRHKINEIVHKMDRGHVITRPMIEYGGPPALVQTIATERSWSNRSRCYLCPLCYREFQALLSLNQHLRSPAHDQPMYNCPQPGCGANFKLLSGLVSHFESERCGAMRFADIQRNAGDGLHRMIGRMIM